MKYKFKVGQRVVTQTGHEGVVAHRFHPDKESNTYVVHLNAGIPMQLYEGYPARSFTFAEFFLEPL